MHVSTDATWFHRQSNSAHQSDVTHKACCIGHGRVHWHTLLKVHVGSVFLITRCLRSRISSLVCIDMCSWRVKQCSSDILSTDSPTIWHKVSAYFMIWDDNYVFRCQATQCQAQFISYPPARSRFEKDPRTVQTTGSDKGFQPRPSPICKPYRAMKCPACKNTPHPSIMNIPWSLQQSCTMWTSERHRGQIPSSTKRCAIKSENKVK